MKINSIGILSLCILLAMAGCTKKSTLRSASLVLHHGKVLTMDSDNPVAEALAIDGEMIMAVGSDEDINPYIGIDTKVIDLEGMLVVPGIIDGHGHFMSLGESLMGIDLRTVQTWDEIVSMVAEEVQ